MFAVTGRIIAVLIIVREQGVRAGGNYIIGAALPPAGPIMDRRERRMQEQGQLWREIAMERMNNREMELVEL